MLSRLVSKKLAAIFLWSALFGQPQTGITYEFSGGRFGDNLVSYVHAKWISYKYQIPLYYKPFLYSSHLILEEREKHFAALEDNSYELIRWTSPPDFYSPRPIVYACPYFPEVRWEQAHIQDMPPGYLQIDWKDPLFRREIQALIAPKRPLLLITPPADKITVALHYRDGGGHDRGMGSCLPLKFPELEFYVGGLLKTIELTGGHPLYCFVFTDARVPSELVDRLRASLPPSASIEFDFRRRNNRHHFNVLEDFFSLLQFDVLIRPESNFSMIPSLMHDYAICYSPIDGTTIDEKVVITKVDCKVDPPLLEKALFKACRR